jgi:hypothetical protein
MSLSVMASAMALLTVAAVAAADEGLIEVDAGRRLHRVSPYLVGACIEDVNHEIYGGLYSQMLYGESFGDPPPTVPPRGFHGFGGTWTVKDGELAGSAGEGPKLAADLPAFADGGAEVEVRFDDRAGGNAGLVMRLAKAGEGADNFDGYEVSLDPAANLVRLGRHHHDWHALVDTPCEVPVGQWILLGARLEGSRIEISVDGKVVARFDDGGQVLGPGTVGLRQWTRAARYRRLSVTSGGRITALPFETADATAAVSAWWRPLVAGTAAGGFALVTEQPFAGPQCQRVTFERGEGGWGVQNLGLGHVGLHLAGGQPYEGVVWARATAPVTLTADLAAGDETLAASPLAVEPGAWRRLTFSLTPARTADRARFGLYLTSPGTVDLGYACLQPGPWGRFHDLPVRRDVGQAMVDLGLTVLRYGGSMVNTPEYRWKRMIGPRDQRQPYHGTWHPHTTNGWGIIDFLAFCRAAGFLAIPAFNTGESPQDMADFIEYVNGPPDSPWGARRVADGYGPAFGLTHLEFGNEERVDENYLKHFRPVAEAIWAKDPKVVIVVGDFVYGQPITDPDHVTGAASGLASLAAQRQIVALAKARGAEVWFDLHVGTDGPTALSRRC